MTELEAGKIVAIIAEAYPRFLDGRSIENTVTLWHRIFEADPYPEVEAAFFAFVSSDEKGFPPAPGALRAILDKLRKPKDETTETEAWALVRKACGNSLYNAAEEFEKLPADIQRCVGSPSQLRDWAAS